jgi:hypothetical protein
MRILGFARYALGACGAAVMFAGCSGGSPLAPTPGAQNAAPASSRAALGRSWMAPDLNLKKKDLLYVPSGNEILAFTYPGGKPVGALTGITGPAGECTSSTSMGNWWVVASGEILEFAHGGTSPISTLKVTGLVSSCAVDPTTGNLAAVTSNGIVIYRHARGRGKTYATPNGFFDGYDNKGNLFVDGFNANYAFTLVELPKGSNSFETITLNQTIEFPGGVQWDAGSLAVEDQQTSNVYQFAISGTNGTLKGTTTLQGASDIGGSWIQKPDLVGADAGNDDVEIWRYPTGGMSVKTICSSCSPTGVVVSVAPK